MKARLKLVRPHTRKISIRRQCELLSVNRSSLYYKPVPEKPENVKMMEVMDRHLTEHPTEGVRSLVLMFAALGHHAGPKRMRRLLKLMGRQTLYRRKNLTRAGLKEFIRPYLLKGLVIDRPNQVWCTDITYIPMKQGFMYMTAYIDVYSRRIMGWGIGNSLGTKWCLDVLKDAISQNGKPQIINSDQGCQYTSAAWTQYLRNEDIQISMDGKGRALDNVWIERFWKSLKYDYVYLNPADDGLELLEGVQRHISYYNTKTHHTTRKSPNQMYNDTIKKAA
jgi:putative transposase